jgi:hypothetical protein
METETKTLTFEPTNLTGPQDGKHSSEWTEHTVLAGTDCGATEPKGNLGEQVIKPAHASIWEDGGILVRNEAVVGNLRIDNLRFTQRDSWRRPVTEKVGALEQTLRVHRVTSITQQRVMKLTNVVTRGLVITLENGDKFTLELFGDDVASVTINAKFSADRVGRLTAKEVK